MPTTLTELKNLENLKGLPALALPLLKGFRGRVILPGSKSIANRALILSGLARGETRLTNLPDSEDVRVLIDTMPALGLQIREETAREGGRGALNLVVSGAGGPFRPRKKSLNLENAGTAMRPLGAVLAAGQGEIILDGNEQMRRRPIKDLTLALRGLGVDIECSSEGTPPVRIRASGLPGGRVEISGKVSSQFISALLLAAPLARDEDLNIILPEAPVSKPYIDLTLAMMADFGVTAERDGYRSFRVPHNSTYKSPGEYYVEGDASAATYFLAAGAIPGAGPVKILGVGKNSRQGDLAFAELMERMGARVQIGEREITVSPGPQKLKAPDIDMNHMPDAAMTLAVLALYCDGVTHIRNIANLRVKESERIAGLRRELEKLGAIVAEEEDALHITPPGEGEIKSAFINTYKDHRMAMAFSLAAFLTPLTIEDPACVGKTYPGYFFDFLDLCEL